jgi:hypothetical protein
MRILVNRGMQPVQLTSEWLKSGQRKAGQQKAGPQKAGRRRTAQHC